MQVRASLLNNGQDPCTGKFFCSEWEKLTILDRPPFMNPDLSAEREHICGLKIYLIPGGPPPGDH
jgi:hypothetical protein